MLKSRNFLCLLGEANPQGHEEGLCFACVAGLAIDLFLQSLQPHALVAGMLQARVEISPSTIPYTRSSAAYLVECTEAVVLDAEDDLVRDLVDDAARREKPAGDDGRPSDHALLGKLAIIWYRCVMHSRSLQFLQKTRHR